MQKHISMPTIAILITRLSCERNKNDEFNVPIATAVIELNRNARAAASYGRNGTVYTVTVWLTIEIGSTF